MVTLQEVSDYLSVMPGNALGSTVIHGIAGDAPVKVGEGAKQTNWTRWLSDVASIGYSVVSPVSAYMPTAKQIGEEAGAQVSAFVSKAEDKVTAAATGIGSYIKIVSYALIALAVLYIAALFGPVLLAPFQGRK